MDFKHVAIVSVKRSDYRIHFWYMGKSDAINIMKNSDLNEKSKLLYFFVIQKKDNKTTYYQKNKEKILNRTKEYYESNKKRLTEQTRNKYRELSNKKRDKKKENMEEIDIKICLETINKD